MGPLNTFLVIWIDYLDTNQPKAALITTTLGAEAAPAAVISNACDMTFDEAAGDIEDATVRIIAVLTGDIALRGGELHGSEVMHYGKHLLKGQHEQDPERQTTLEYRNGVMCRV